LEPGMTAIADLGSKYPKLGSLFAKAQQNFPANLASRHEHLLREIEAARGTAECVRLLDDLVFSDRPDRLGFTYDVMMELFALKGHHDRLYPQFVANQFDPFAYVAAGESGAKADRKASKRMPEPGAKESPQPAQVVANEVPGLGGVQPVSAQGPLGPMPTTSKPSETAWPEVFSLDELRNLVRRRASGERMPLRDKRMIVEILKQYAAISDADLDKAIRLQAGSGQGKKREPIGKVLLKLGIVGEELVIRALCLQYGVFMVNLQRFQIDAETMRLISPEVARSLRAIPVADFDGILFLAVENPFGFDQREYFTFLTKRKVELVMASASQITRQLQAFGQVRSVQQGKEEFRHLAQKALGIR